MAANGKEQDKSTATAPPLWPAEFVEQVAASVIQQIGPYMILPAKRLYNVEEAAVYLGRKPSAIRELERTGKLKRVSRDARVMFDRCDLDAWIEAGK